MQIISTISVLAVALSTCVEAIPTASIEKRGILVKRNNSTAPTSMPGYRVRTWWENFTHQDGIKYNWWMQTGTQYNSPNAPPQWGTNEIQTYTQHPDNLAIKNGILTIQPMERPVGPNGALIWTSGRIESKQSWACATGGKMRIEASLKFGSATADKAHGIWPAFWAMSEDFRRNKYAGWPWTGEWDIAESIMGQRTQYGLLHCDVNPGGACNEPTGMGTSWYIPRGVWIKVGFEVDRTNSNWRLQRINWYLDVNQGAGSQLKLTVTGAQINKQDVWAQLTAKPYFLLANVAVGGAWADYLAGGAPGSGSPNSRTLQDRFNNFEIDWVAIFHT